MKCKSRCFATKNESDNVIIGKRSLFIKSDTSMEAAGWIFSNNTHAAFLPTISAVAMNQKEK